MVLSRWSQLVRLYERSLVRLLAGQLPENYPIIESDPEFQATALRIAERMVAEVAHANASSWRAAAFRGTNSRQIYMALQREIEQGGMRPGLHAIALRNAQLITSLPQYIARNVSLRAAEMNQAGMRPEAIAKEIRGLAPKVAKSRIRMIARTEISHAETDLTMMRSQDLGIDWGQWLTSEDSRVRPSHRNLDKVLMRWNDPPQPEALIGQKSTLGHGLAGAFPNCRCLMDPIADLGEISWPAKVYMSGSIRKMTRKQFSALSPLYRKAA